MTRKSINLALQGGGAHGAFTWGVLDRLLQDDRIDIAGVSGTSAGALNGAALKSGMIANGHDGARANLDWLWEQVGAVDDDRMPAWFSGIEPGMISRAIEYSVPYAMADAWSRIVSPYSYGPAYRNPLTSIVDKFDFGQICADQGPDLFIGATCVRTGKIKVFQGESINTQAILASACLPTLFQAIEIEDPDTGIVDAYWDGGYTGNPALFPLFNRSLPDDIVIININPLERESIPTTPQQIHNRINEISFNSSLFRELRAISFVQRLIDAGTIEQGSMARVNVHMIADDDLMNDLSVATKTVPTAPVLNRLKKAGQAAADLFLERDLEHVGHRNSVDLRAMFG